MSGLKYQRIWKLFFKRGMEGTRPSVKTSTKSESRTLRRAIERRCIYRAKNDQRLLLAYRIRPSVCQGKFQTYKHPKINRKVFERILSPKPMRWSPLNSSTNEQDFIDSLWVYTGKPEKRSGVSVSLYDACFP